MQLWLAIISLVVLPICYLVLCTDMRESRVPRPPYAAYFFLFGTVGGWLLALMLSPSGLAALCMVFLVTLAPVALLISAIVLASRSERTRYHQAAMLGGFIYSGGLGLFMVIASVFRR